MRELKRMKTEPNPQRKEQSKGSTLQTCRFRRSCLRKKKAASDSCQLGADLALAAGPCVLLINTVPRDTSLRQGKGNSGHDE